MGLEIIWTDHRGKAWNLTSGEQGVILDTEQAGLGWAELDHNFTRGELIQVSSRVKRANHNFKVLVGWDKQGTEFYNLYSEWWSQANSPFETGTLTVKRPDGQERSRELRLFESPDTTHTYDPGLGIDPQPELWSLTGNYGWWFGPEQVVSVKYDDIAGSGSGTPFYGPKGAGWPLYISSMYQAKEISISNDGQGPMWLTWTLVGPMSKPRVGIAGGAELTYKGDLLDGEIIEIRTDPTKRDVVQVYGNKSLYGAASGEWAPAPVGQRVPLTVQAESMGPGSAIYASGRVAYAQAF